MGAPRGRAGSRFAAPLSDLRYAARRLRSNQGFTAVSVLTLALGIGASTAIFSVMDGVLLKPLPYPQSGQIVALRHTAPGAHIDDLNLAASLYFTYSEENRVFQDVGMWLPDTASVTGVAEPEEVPALLVTNRFLPVLGVQPAIGRPFTPSDDDPRSEVFTVNLSWLTGSVPTPPAMNAECALRRVEFGAAKRSPAADITPGN